MTKFSDYSELFEKATGVSPYPYQNRIATSDDLPARLSIPTGLGKTAAVTLAWLWRRCFANEEERRRTSRRLVYCLPMRVLVEQTAGCCRSWLHNLGILAAEAPGNHPEGRVAVHVLMGGDLEVEEVEDFYAPYAPFRGLAGDFLLGARGGAVHGPGNRARIRSFARPAKAA